MLYKIS